MSLFLSKLIPPLLLFPLGLSILLLGLGLWFLHQKKSNRIIAFPLVSALLILLLSSNQFVGDAVIRSLEYQYLPTTIPTADAIVVLGGAIKSHLPPRPSFDLSEASDRVFYGVQLFREGRAPRIIFSGGRIDWLKEGGPPESADMAAMAIFMGVPESAILQDPLSLNTRENALNVKQIMALENIHNILLVTSAIHMPRSVAIFRKLEIETFPAPTDFLTAMVPSDQGFMGFLLDVLPNTSVFNNLTNAIKEYIGLVFYRWRGWA